MDIRDTQTPEISVVVALACFFCVLCCPAPPEQQGQESDPHTVALEHDMLKNWQGGGRHGELQKTTNAVVRASLARTPPRRWPTSACLPSPDLCRPLRGWTQCVPKRQVPTKTERCSTTTACATPMPCRPESLAARPGWPTMTCWMRRNSIECAASWMASEQLQPCNGGRWGWGANWQVDLRQVDLHNG